MNHFYYLCTMRRIILILIALLVTASASAQQITDSGYRTVAHIKADGTIQEITMNVSPRRQKTTSTEEI